ncbi:MAG: branched chain amino acid aminotransferase, partial [Bacteroidia bacterium]|nr:branched chain amino acid aminotransferase [Bacteroidia bacterium]
ISIIEIIDAAKANKLTDAFGTGTAAIIAKIASIGYEGVDYELPPAESRLVSNWLYQNIYQIQTGKQEDTLNWVMAI